MALIIRANSWFVSRYLKLKDHGVEFMETAAMGGKRKITFGQISFVLMSPKHVLSLQVGNEVFSIQTKPNKAKHQAVIDGLLAGVGRDRSVGFPVIQPGQRS